MASEKELSRGNSGSLLDPLMPHSPTQVHTHISTQSGFGMGQPSSSGSGSGSSMEENAEESDISDMVVDNTSRFASLSRKRLKSGGSDYQPPSQASDRSESEESDSGTGSESATDNASYDRSSYSNETPQRPSPNIPRHNQIQKGISPFIGRGSPMSNSSTRSKLSDVTMRSGHSYQLCPPRRTAARNVNYNKFIGYSSDDSIDVEPERPFRHGRGRYTQSDSEFEMSGGEENASSSFSEGNSYLVDESSDNELGSRRKRRGGQRKKMWDDDGSDSDYRPVGSRRKGRTSKKPAKRINEGYEHSYQSAPDLTSDTDSEFEPGNAKRKKKRKRHHQTKGDFTSSDFVRMTSRKRGVISYKETSSSANEDSDGVLMGEGAEGEGGEGGELVEDNRECIEKVLKKRNGRIGDTGNRTTWYAMKLNTTNSQHTEGEGNSAPLIDTDTEVQYLVKWRNWSHLHNTWETEKTLASQDLKGMKRFYNFLKREEEREAWEKEANPEDIEYVKCQEELVEQLLEEFTKVERVIAARHSEEGSQEYFCKWRGLPYSECTWEDGNLISTWYQDEIDSYLERNATDRIPNKSAPVLRHRPKFARKEQLRELGGKGQLQLRDYQLEGVNWLVKSWCKNNSVILADEMGLGKTIQTIAFLHFLYHMYRLYGPFLIVVPLSTLPAWQREFEAWAPESNTVVYIGDVSSRNKIREYEWCHENKKLKFNSLLTTYEILLKDKEFLGSVAWSVLVVDEAHRLKNDDSLLYRTLMEFRTNHRLLITGTPLQNSLKELWSLLHFIMEKRFYSWEEFEREHQAYGEGDASSLISLHQQLQPYLLRRMKKDVEKSLPAKVEQILRVDMSSMQKQYYRWILTKNYKALSKGVKGSIAGFINLVMELKKCCNHIWIVRSPDDHETKSSDKLQTLIRGSGKLYLLDKLLVRLKEKGHRVLIFSQMVRMLDILAEYMQLRHFLFQRLDGSIRGDKRKDAIDHFNAEGSQDFCFLLSTRAGGLGVNLATADTVVIFDSDWNPQNDLQAQARAHRIGQKKQVNIYRLVTKNSVEEDIVERAKKKMVLDHLVIQRMDTTGRTVLSRTSEPNNSTPFDKEELNAILKFGAEDLFKESKEGDKGDTELQEMDIDEILRRAETQTSIDETSSHDDLLSQFKVASFAMEEEELDSVPLTTPTEGKPLLLSPGGTRMKVPKAEKSWDEIITDEVREQFDEEEKQKEQLQLYLPPRQRTVQNYCEDAHTKSGRRIKSATATTTSSSRRREKAPPTSRSAASDGATLSKNVRGFSDSEIRRFVKSYRKFSNPKTRLEAIAADSELQEKSLSELERLVDILHDTCEQAEAEHRARVELDPDYNPKKDKGASLRLSGVTISCSSILKREEELSALAVCIPSDAAARKKYRLLTRPKPVQWSGVRWSAVDDAKLLIGVYDHGLGNWDSIREDTTLGLTNKILHVDKSRKPQSSHLQTRAEYLLKLVQMEAKQKQKKSSKGSKSSTKSKSSPTKQKTASKSRTRTKPPQKNEKISKYFAPTTGSSNAKLTVNIPRELVDIDSDFEADPTYKRRGTRATKRGASSRSPTKQPASKRAKISSRKKAGARMANSRAMGRGKKQPKVKTVSHQQQPVGVKGKRELFIESGVSDEKGGGLSDTGEEGVSVELEENVFQKCKSLLRPVKKCISSLEPKEGLSPQEILEHYKKALIEIGDRIGSCLSEYKTDEKATEWRTNLWVFVSQFTSASPEKLHKIYKRAKKETLQHSSLIPIKKRYLDNMAASSTTAAATTSSMPHNPPLEVQSKDQSKDFKMDPTSSFSTHASNEAHTTIGHTHHHTRVFDTHTSSERREHYDSGYRDRDRRDSSDGRKSREGVYSRESDYSGHSRERGRSSERGDSLDRGHSRDRGHSWDRGHSRDRGHFRRREDSRERGRSKERKYSRESEHSKESDNSRERDDRKSGRDSNQSSNGHHHHHHSHHHNPHHSYHHYRDDTSPERRPHNYSPHDSYDRSSYQHGHFSSTHSSTHHRYRNH